MPLAIIGGLISGVGSLAGGAMSAGAASDAASQQVAAANNAAGIQQQQFQQTSNNLLPWLQTGTTAQSILGTMLGIDWTKGTFDPTAQLLQNPQAGMPGAPTYSMPQFQYSHSPGYNAALQGGVEAIQNAGSTTTGGLSGNTLNALMGKGSQLANQDYQQNYQNFVGDYVNQYNAQSNNYWNTLGQSNTAQNNIYSRLLSLSGAGQNAAVNTGGFGAGAASNIGNAMIGAGNAQAAGTIGSANAMSGGINNALTGLMSPSNSYNNSTLAAILYGGGGGAGSGMYSGMPGPGTGGLY